MRLATFNIDSAIETMLADKRKLQIELQLCHARASDLQVLSTNASPMFGLDPCITVTMDQCKKPNIPVYLEVTSGL